MLNRTALVVRPMQPFVDWVRGVEDDGAEPDAEREQTIYRIPGVETAMDFDAVLRVVYTDAALSRSGDLRVLDRLRLVEILQELGRETTGRIVEADAMAMARRARVGTLITGEIVGSGSTIRVQCKVVDASTGRLLHSEIVEGAGDDDVFKMVAQLTDALQTYLHIQAVGETVDESWIRDVTSRSLDAFRHYVRGRSLLMSSQWVEARGELEAAIAADSNFVMAYVDLTGACFNMEDYPCIGAAYAHALRLRPRAAPRRGRPARRKRRRLLPRTRRRPRPWPMLPRRGPHGGSA